MKVAIDSQWNEAAFIPARIKQFTKAARLLGSSSFAAYYFSRTGSGLVDESTDHALERRVVGQWIQRNRDAVGRQGQVA